jgi:hypothetical protein
MSRYNVKNFSGRALLLKRQILDIRKVRKFLLLQQRLAQKEFKEVTGCYYLG